MGYSVRYRNKLIHPWLLPHIKKLFRVIKTAIVDENVYRKIETILNEYINGQLGY